MSSCTATVKRNTRETRFDGDGAARLDTGIPFFEHMLWRGAGCGPARSELEPLAAAGPTVFLTVVGVAAAVVLRSVTRLLKQGVMRRHPGGRIRLRSTRCRV